VRATTLLTIVLGLKKTRVTAVAPTADGLVADVTPTARRPYCSGCYRHVARVYDGRVRTWRHLDLGGMALRLRYRIRRLACPRCGVTTELVPWAAPGAWFTRDFEDHAAYLAQRADRTTVAALLRVAWPTVGQIVARVVARRAPADRLDGLTHIGVDELAYRRHHAYVTVIVDHVTRAVVWIKEGRSAATLAAFFAELGPARAARLEAVTLDLSGAYLKAVTEASPQAQVIFDRFHVQRLAHDALDEVRRAQVRTAADPDAKAALKKTRWALQKSAWNLHADEHAKLVTIQRRNKPLYRAYLLKESLAAILDLDGVATARRRLTEWCRWAARSRLAPFKKVAGTIRAHADGILAYVASGLSNGRTEGLNGKIRTITRRSFGFHSAESLIGLIFLCCSGLVLQPVVKVPGS
jgi:transposase